MSESAFSLPPGFFDIVPEAPKERWKDSSLWNFLEANLRRLASLYALQEIRSPILEPTELFERTSGEEAEICEKEMYRFLDRSGRSLCLRPEGTAGVLRAFCDAHLDHQKEYHRLFYYGPMFRYDRPQKGRYRQHQQFGVEIIGSSRAEQDAELISMLLHFYKLIGVDRLTVHLNSLGEKHHRLSYLKILKEYFHDHADQLSSLSQQRLQGNVLRILDSKEPLDHPLIAKAPTILDHLSEPAKERFSHLTSLLKALKIPYKIDPTLVRGLDYYCHTVFEIKCDALGAQNSLGGGGRYDGLLAQIGGKDLPAVGFATGIERILIALTELGRLPSQESSCDLYIIPLGMQERERALILGEALRKGGVKTLIEMCDRKLTKTLSFANSLNAKYVAILGEKELEKEVVSLKEMETQKQEELSFEELLSRFHTMS